MHPAQLFLSGSAGGLVADSRHGLKRQQIGNRQESARVFRVAPLGGGSIKKPAEHGLYSAVQFAGLKGRLSIRLVSQHAFIVDDQYIAFADQGIILRGAIYVYAHCVPIRCSTSAVMLPSRRGGGGCPPNQRRCSQHPGGLGF